MCRYRCSGTGNHDNVFISVIYGRMVNCCMPFMPVTITVGLDQMLQLAASDIFITDRDAAGSTVCLKV